MLNEIILRLVEETKGIEEIEERVAELVFELGRAILKVFFEHLDQELMKRREKGLRNLGTRERNALTRFGTIKVGRRYYRDPEGEHRFLLDEALGLRERLPCRHRGRREGGFGDDLGDLLQAGRQAPLLLFG